MKVLDWTRKRRDLHHHFIWLEAIDSAATVAMSMPKREGRVRVWIPLWFGRVTGNRMVAKA